MKKSTKSMLITALILFCAGLLLALSSALFVKIMGIDAFGIIQKEKHVETKTVSLSEILGASPESSYVKKLTKNEFGKISIRNFAGDVEIRSGEETKLELVDANTNNLKWEIVGETLTVSELDPVCFMGLFIDENGISFRGLRQIFSRSNPINSGRKIILYVKEEQMPKEIVVDSVIGDVRLDGVSSESARIKLTFGNLSVNDFQKEGAKLSLTGTAADFDITSSIYGNCNINTKLGNIHLLLPSQDCDTTVLETLLGNVSVQTSVPSFSFKLNFSTTLGNVLKNGEKMGKELNESSQNAKRITLKTLIGNLSLTEEVSQEVDYTPVVGPETAEPTQTEELPVTVPETVPGF